MGQLAELLELLDGAGRRYSALRATTHIRVVTALAAEALQRHQESLGDRRTSALAAQARREPATVETEMRVWLDRPDRMRVELVRDGARNETFVDDGEREWSHTRGSAAFTHPSQKAHRYGFEPLFRPHTMLARVQLHPLGEAEWAGRRALHARATTRPGRPDFTFELPPGAESFDLLIDRERGVILRLAAFLAGDEFHTLEVGEIAFDETLPAETFRFDPPEGVEVVDVDAMPEPEEVSLPEAISRAPFTVLAPTRVPEGATRRVRLVEADERFGQPTTVSLGYDFDGGLHYLSISESAQSDLPLDEGFEAIERNGRRMHARDMGGQRQVLAERLGTDVALVSDLPLDLLVEIAASLEPAS
jgi:outer membrane lipoprotein-sorting protein